MKKIITLLLAAVMLTLTISLVSCGGNNNSTTTTEPGVTTTTNTNATTTSNTNTATTTTEATTTTTTPDVPVTPAYANALDLFNKIWGSYTDDDKFPVGGGDEDHNSDEGPGAFDIEKNKESIKAFTHITDDLLATVKNDAANLIHMMNTNTFSSAIFHLKDAKTAESFAKDYNSAIMGTRWMCGFPERVLVISVDEYVIVAFGFAELTDTFKAKCLAADTSAKLLIDNAIEA